MKSHLQKIKSVLVLILLLFLILFVPATLLAQEKSGLEHEQQIESEETEAWTGIDVSIVGKYASKYGRPPRDPYINTDQGDLLLFVFTLAGVVGGFVMGFNARKLFFEK